MVPADCTPSAERWLPVVGFEGLYSVSDLGRVRSEARGWVPQSRLLKPDPRPRDGYLYICLWKERRRRGICVHRLVLEAFVGPRPQGMQCRHLNGHKRDNRLINLCWGTSAENAADRDRHGRTARGDEHWSRLSPERLARGDQSGSRLHPERLARGERNGSRTRPERVPRGDRNGSRTRPDRRPRGKTHYSKLQPEKVARGDRHASHLHPELRRGERNGRAKLTEEAVRVILRRLAVGERPTAIARDFGVAWSLICMIRDGKIWRHIPPRTAARLSLFGYGMTIMYLRNGDGFRHLLPGLVLAEDHGIVQLLAAAIALDLDRVLNLLRRCGRCGHGDLPRRNAGSGYRHCTGRQAEKKREKFLSGH